jgi:CBS domain-containing protein
VPRVLGVGYETISDILNNRLPLTMLFLVMIFKALALLVSLGSGTSGGLLAPMFMSSAAMGGIFAILINQVVPGANLAPGAYALVAMAAVFGAASRSTFAFIIFAFEITRDYNAILPLMLVCVIADAVALYFMRNTIMTEKLARRGLRVHQDYEVDVLQQATVGEMMDPAPATIRSDMLVSELMDRIGQHDPVLTRHQALPIIDEDERLVGIITRSDILAALEQDLESSTCVLDVGTDSLVVTYKDEMLSAAVDKMLQHDIGRLLVVERKDPQKLLGYLSRGGILRARQRRLRDEHLLERGWLWSTIRRVNDDR